MRIPCLERPQAYLGVQAHANLIEPCVFHVDYANVTLEMGLGLLTAEIFQIHFGSWSTAAACCFPISMRAWKSGTDGWSTVTRRRVGI